MDSAAAFKCDGYRLESLLAGHIDKVSVHLRGGSMWIYEECTLGANYTGENSYLICHRKLTTRYTWETIFFN